jgi:hypothetical protein
MSSCEKSSFSQFLQLRLLYYSNSARKMKITQILVVLIVAVEVRIEIHVLADVEIALAYVFKAVAAGTHCL